MHSELILLNSAALKPGFAMHYEINKFLKLQQCE